VQTSGLSRWVPFFMCHLIIASHFTRCRLVQEYHLRCVLFLMLILVVYCLFHAFFHALFLLFCWFLAQNWFPSTVSLSYCLDILTFFSAGPCLGTSPYLCGPFQLHIFGFAIGRQYNKVTTKKFEWWTPEQVRDGAT